MGLVCQSSVSIRHPRFLLFPLLEKGLSKKGKDWPGVSYFILKGVAFYPEWFVHHYKGNVQFYRECEGAVLCVWDRRTMTDAVIQLFPKCILGSIIVPNLFILRLPTIIYIEVASEAWKETIKPWYFWLNVKYWSNNWCFSFNCLVVWNKMTTFASTNPARFP